MPVEFLTDEQRRRYGRFHGDPTQKISPGTSILMTATAAFALRRGDHKRLGFAVQLCAARYLGVFPEDLTETPTAVVSILGRQ